MVPEASPNVMLISDDAQTQLEVGTSAKQPLYDITRHAGIVDSTLRD